MRLTTLSLPTPAENLALEEWLLEQAEQGCLEDEVLRIWPASQPFIVIGRGSRIAGEVNLEAAQQAGVPVLRRISGGASIVAAPGCLMYALFLSYERRPHLRMLDAAHETVMQSLVGALGPLEPRLTYDGTCDLVVSGRKVSGNSVRCRRDWMLYHGTLLIDMDLSLLDRFLLHPPREPEYRQKRKHSDFTTNLRLSEDNVVRRLSEIWKATSDARNGGGTDLAAFDLPIELNMEAIQRLAREKYMHTSWTFER